MEHKDIKVNEISGDGSSDKIICLGIFILKSISSTGKYIRINEHPVRPLIISETEPINIGDEYVKDGGTYTCIARRNDARHGGIIVWGKDSERATTSYHHAQYCKKILVSTEQLPAEFIERIESYGIKTGDKVKVECIADYSNAFSTEGYAAAGVEYKIKLIDNKAIITTFNRKENSQLEILYQEAQERLKYLEAQEQTNEIKWRTEELTLTIIRVQQMLLVTLNDKKEVECQYEQDDTTAMNCKYCGRSKWLHNS